MLLAGQEGCCSQRVYELLLLLRAVGFPPAPATIVHATLLHERQTLQSQQGRTSLGHTTAMIPRQHAGFVADDLCATWGSTAPYTPALAADAGLLPCLAPLLRTLAVPQCLPAAVVMSALLVMLLFRCLLGLVLGRASSGEGDLQHSTECCVQG